jgi:hypothetical protein
MRWYTQKAMFGYFLPYIAALDMRAEPNAAMPLQGRGIASMTLPSIDSGYFMPVGCGGVMLAVQLA